ncbi:MAG TPA: hypothetical protein VMW83_02530 [Spirochaetia bacterium]|nr:hypothetical protein [Spirochaetia bacterium]
MMRQTEEIYRDILGFYLNVIHDCLDELPNWNRNITKNLAQDEGVF